MKVKYLLSVYAIKIFEANSEEPLITSEFTEGEDLFDLYKSMVNSLHQSIASFKSGEDDDDEVLKKYTINKYYVIDKRRAIYGFVDSGVNGRSISGTKRRINIRCR